MGYGSALPNCGIVVRVRTGREATMDEVELLKALGDVWDDATEIIGSMHALRKKIVALHADAEGDD
jgi:hypothetical protein